MKDVHKRTTNRTPLETVVPLPAPFVLFIEPISYCNFKCKFCPTGDKSLLESVGRTQHIMNMELFHKIISDISELPQKIKTIIFQGDGEPTMNKNIGEMIRIAKKEYGCNHVELTTNASLLTPDLADILIDSGLDKIKISINGLNSVDYKANCGVDIDFEYLKKNVEYIYKNKKQCHIYVKCIDFLVEGEREKRFYEMFEPISDSCFVEHSLNWTANHLSQFSYENDEIAFDGNPLRAGKICPFPLWTSYISANGDVGVCNNDWSRATVYGNIKEECYSEIWNGRKLYEFRMMHLNSEEKGNRACGHCSYRKIALENIDEHVEIIRNKLTKQFD